MLPASPGAISVKPTPTSSLNITENPFTVKLSRKAARYYDSNWSLLVIRVLSKNPSLIYLNPDPRLVHVPVITKSSVLIIFMLAISPSNDVYCYEKSTV